MSFEQQQDLGILALAAFRYSMSKETGTGSVLTCSAIAHLIPHLADSDIRLLTYEVETAITKHGAFRAEWVELLTDLRRMDAP